MTQPMDTLLLDWLESTPGVPRRERQALLLKELMDTHDVRSLALYRDSSGNDADTQHDANSEAALAEREMKLCAALRNTMMEVVDVADARRASECLTVSTDLDVLYGAIDARCVMTLRVAGDGTRRSSMQLRGIDAIINELSEFQESILLLRVDSSTSPVRSHNSHVLSHAIAVRGVSPVKSWLVQCDVELEVGTQVTYYADTACAKAIFDLRSSFLFSADGTRVERVSRELLPRGGYHVDDLLRAVHFGVFQP